MAEPARIVAVLGYSTRRSGGLHPVCVSRLRHAETLAAGARAVVLSGWARHPDGPGEAELMRAAWAGPDVPLVCDPTASSTVENAVAVAATARELGAGEVVLVTSWWHRPRAGALVRRALPDGIALRTSSPRGAPPPGALLRELACLLALPVQTLLLRRSLREQASTPASAS